MGSLHYDIEIDVENEWCGTAATVLQQGDKLRSRVLNQGLSHNGMLAASSSTYMAVKQKDLLHILF